MSWSNPSIPSIRPIPHPMAAFVVGTCPRIGPDSTTFVGHIPCHPPMAYVECDSRVDSLENNLDLLFCSKLWSFKNAYFSIRLNFLSILFEKLNNGQGYDK
jgi:hypothetical protein